MFMHNRQVADGAEQGAGGAILITAQLPVLRVVYGVNKK